MSDKTVKDVQREVAEEIVKGIRVFNIPNNALISIPEVSENDINIIMETLRRNLPTKKKVFITNMDVNVVENSKELLRQWINES